MKKEDTEIERPHVFLSVTMCVLMCLLFSYSLPAKSFSKCPGRETAKKALSRFKADDHGATVSLLVKADMRYGGGALLCFFKLASSEEIPKESYRQLGLSLLEAGGEGISLEAELALKYLEGSEWAYRMASGSQWEDADSMLVRLGLARSLVEQVFTHEQRHLGWEAEYLLKSYLENNSSSQEADWAREMIEKLHSVNAEHDAVADYPTDPVHVGGAVSPPERLYSPQPRYTKDARMARVQGVVILEGIIDLNGNLTNAKVLRGLPMGLSRTAINKFESWKFKPALLNNEPVPVYYNFTVNFRLQ